ncbi:hypothetical protein BC939DRAFT_143214 [Gamsiella multidivaricata]|uniref:uncharacterized protein n=1 Tax=Gamsiella multidivaricata TaxID=101098 RepID=UPI00221E8647|nr:uncharacterized protein BC939DRAFT_143214 [Gamsiella multidivaricata]KAI7824380.1 hypothetical protein BC939DRAFT_143214 [Gamsiella multidivaricata]
MNGKRGRKGKKQREHCIFFFTFTHSLFLFSSLSPFSSPPIPRPPPARPSSSHFFSLLSLIPLSFPPAISLQPLAVNLHPSTFRLLPTRPVPRKANTTASKGSFFDRTTPALAASRSSPRLHSSPANKPHARVNPVLNQPSHLHHSSPCHPHFLPIQLQLRHTHSLYPACSVLVLALRLRLR